MFAAVAALLLAASTPAIPAPPVVRIVDTRPGKGAVATAGQLVTVRYTGWLADAKGRRGTKFDASPEGPGFDFPLGAGQVIAGWDEGVQGMKIGGKRTLTIPPELGYGPEGAGGVIPPNATLIFDIELIGVR